MNIIPESHRDLFTADAVAYAYLATLMPNGSPQLTPLWFDNDGTYILINTAKGRTKDKNMRVRKQVAILITDPQDPFGRYVQIRGQVVEISEEGALEHINKLSLRYDKKPWTPVAGQTRVMYKIQPEKVYVSK
ncbi:MAG: PPOX class F420-dependent oxidoreductase [Chloroflexota bacterium]